MSERWLALGLPGDEEERYRRHCLRPDVNQVSVGIGLLGLVLLALFYNDYLFFGPGPLLYVLLALRAAVLLLGLALVLWLRFRIRDHHHYDRLVFLWALAGIAAVLLIGLSRPHDYYGAAVINVLIVAGVYLVIPIRLPHQFLLATFFTLAEIGIFLRVKMPPDRMTAYAVVIAFLTANAMGAASSWSLQSYRRREFRAREEEGRVRAELNRLASQDELTGIANRRFFLQRAETELARFGRYGKPFTVLMLDLDHFKAVNDRFGHLAGDRVLQGFVRAVLAQIRDVDLLGRLGGEEFGLLLPETGEATGREAAERIRKTLNGTDMVLDSGEAIRITTSIGLSEVRRDDASLDVLLSRADTALYRAKDRGRDRIEVYSGRMA